MRKREFEVRKYETTRIQEHLSTKPRNLPIFNSTSTIKKPPPKKWFPAFTISSLQLIIFSMAFIVVASL